MASTNNQTEEGNTNIQSVTVKYDYVEPNNAQNHQAAAANPSYDDRCCGCFDIRSGIIMLGIWLLIESVITVTIWFTFANDYYKGAYHGYYIADFVFEIVFNTCGMIDICILVFINMFKA